ncbi:MAG: RNA polymerase sigma factor [Planctomycetota bacterium]
MTCLDAHLSDTCGTLPSVPAGMPIADEDLVDLLRQGSTEVAMTGIQNRYGRRLHHFVQGIVREQHLAQDVVQEVLEKVLVKHDLYQPGTNFRAWLFEVARNQALSALRQQRRLPRPVSALRAQDETQTDLLDRVAADPDDRALEEAEFMAEFDRAVADLPEHYRVVFDLCVRQGRPYQEAADRLGMPTGTVAIRIMRARKLLFGALERHFDRLRRPPACFQKAG